MIPSRGILALALMLIMPVPLPATAADPLSWSDQGADTCLKCHDEDSAFPVMAIFATPHGRRSDPRSPMAGFQCEACHGPGGVHAGRFRDEAERPPMPAFGPHASDPVSRQNDRCLDCHRERGRIHWAGSAHASEDLLCSSCHSLHGRRDAVMQVATQAGLCLGCHPQVRADTLQLSSHPIRQGRMVCSDCHDVHGALFNDALLGERSARDTCLNCHAEKRGPFLWEHAPAAEDCGLCHRAHGSNHANLLAMPGPLLCQQCHRESGHPSQPFTARGLPEAQASSFLLLGNCGNCHTAVHGSNHPSGSSLMR